MDYGLTILTWYLTIGAISAIKRTYENREEMVSAMSFAPSLATLLVFLGMVLHIFLWLPSNLARAAEHVRTR